jgi:hypothetical protein
MPGDVPSSKNKETKKPEPTFDATRSTRHQESDQGSSGGNHRSSEQDKQLAAKWRELSELQNKAQERLKKQREQLKELKEGREEFAALPLEDQLYLAPTIRSMLPKLKEPENPSSSTPK